MNGLGLISFLLGGLGWGMSYVKLCRLSDAYYGLIREKYPEAWDAMMRLESHAFGFQKRKKLYFSRLTLGIEDPKLSEIRKAGRRWRAVAAVSTIAMGVSALSC